MTALEAESKVAMSKRVDSLSATRRSSGGAPVEILRLRWEVLEVEGCGCGRRSAHLLRRAELRSRAGTRGGGETDGARTDRRWWDGSKDGAQLGAWKGYGVSVASNVVRSAWLDRYTCTGG